MHPDSTTTPGLTEKGKKTEGGKSFVKTNGRQLFFFAVLLGCRPLHVVARRQKIKPVQVCMMRVEEITLDRFGVFLDLTVGSAADNIPHYNLP